ncbi:MAG: ABC transporter ATP-binding protein [Candidatus Woesearchaeota archaeon]
MSKPIDIKNLKKVYSNKIVAVNNVTLEVNKGEVFGFIGPNGAGKTTLIKTLLGLIKPTEGYTYLNGKDSFLKDPQARDKVSYLPAEVGFDKNLKVKEILDLTLKLKKEPDFDYTHLVEKFELPLDIKFGELSSGNKKKLGIINALIGNFEILILDEPTTGLDPLMQQKFLNTLLDIKDKGVTIFISSHILTEVQKVADRIGVIKKGKLISVEEIKNFKDMKVKLVSFESKDFKISDEIKDSIENYYSHNHHHKFDYKGNINKLLKELSKYDIHNIDIKDMDIEKFFLSFYD